MRKYANIKTNIKAYIKNNVTALLISFILTPLAFIAFLLFFPLNGHAESHLSEPEKILSTYTPYDFATTLARVKKQLTTQGFKVAHVQRCDNGLKKMGYEINKYHVVFFGRLDEVREITTKHAELAPFLPFKLLIYTQNNKTVISIMNPELLTSIVTDKASIVRFAQWKQEFVSVLEKTSETSAAL